MLEAIYGFLARMVGNRTDAANANGSLHAKVAQVRNDIAAGAQYKEATPSDNIKISSDSPVSTTSNSYILAKRMYINVTGVVRVSFRLQGGSSADGYYARIYRNGDPYGAERNVTQNGDSTFTQDLFFCSGDTVELYFKTQNSFANVTVSNFRISFDVKSTATYGGAF